jgi:hypothetical protein
MPEIALNGEEFKTVSHARVSYNYYKYFRQKEHNCRYAQPHNNISDEQ